MNNLPRVPTVGVVILDGNKVLLVRHGEKAGHITGSYGTPGGRIDPGERVIDACVRELKEETGLSTEKDSLLEFPEKYEVDIPRKNGKILSISHTVFATLIFSGELVATDETTPQWVDINSLASLPLLPNIEDMVQKAQQYLQILQDSK